MSLEDFGMRLPDYEALRRGDTEATRMYCGSYTLVRTLPPAPFELYRCKGDIPSSFAKVELDNDIYPYDRDGFLLPQYWSLPRVEDQT